MAILKIVIPLLFFCSYSVNAWPNPELRIVGGKNATEGQFPWMVALRDQWSWAHFCEGSIIGQYWVLTAASCVEYKKSHQIHISVGSTKLYPVTQKHDVLEIVKHEYYNASNFLNDIALLKLKTPIQFDKNTKPITLSEKYVDANIQAQFSGWGWLTAVGGKPDSLQYLDVHTVGYEECQDAHNPYKVYNDQQICTLAAIKHGACTEDGGSALVINGEQVGVFSWLRPCAIAIPDVFTRITYYLPWIKANMK